MLGKPVGNDLREGKVTLPLIYALQTASADERAMVRSVLDDNHYNHVPFEEIRALVDRHQGVERARARAHEFTAKSRELLSNFADTPARTALFAATDLVADRDR